MQIDIHYGVMDYILFNSQIELFCAFNEYCTSIDTEWLLLVCVTAILTALSLRFTRFGDQGADFLDWQGDRWFPHYFHMLI